MMLSKEDCGETLKSEIRALRKKYGGFAVDFMNKVCQIEDGDSGDPESEEESGYDYDDESDRDSNDYMRRWNLNWPNIDSLAKVYTDSYDEEYSYVHCCLFEGNSFNDKYQPDPNIFLWTINTIMAKSRESQKIDHPFTINSSTAPIWATILTSNVSERNLSKVRVDMDRHSDPTSLKIWAHDSKVMFGVSLHPWMEEEIYDPFLSDLFFQNRVTKLKIMNGHVHKKFDPELIPRLLLPSLESLKTMKHPALKIVKIDNTEKEMGQAINKILQSLTGLKSIGCLHCSVVSTRQCLDYFVDHFLTHPDCKIDYVHVEWKAEDYLTIRDNALSVDRFGGYRYAATPLEVDYLLKIVHNCPSIRKFNDYDPKIWKYETNVRQPMVKFFVALQQNQVGRGFVLDPSCYTTRSSLGIFSHLLDRAFNRMDTKEHEFDDFDYEYIQYEEGVDHHDQDHPYDGIYYMLKELAGRGVLGNADDISP